MPSAINGIKTAVQMIQKEIILREHKRFLAFRSVSLNSEVRICKSSTPLVETDVDSTVNHHSIVNSSFQCTITFDVIYLSLFVICVLVFTFLVHKLYVKMADLQNDFQ